MSGENFRHFFFFFWDSCKFLKSSGNLKEVSQKKNRGGFLCFSFFFLFFQTSLREMKSFKKLCDAVQWTSEKSETGFSGGNTYHANIESFLRHPDALREIFQLVQRNISLENDCVILTWKHLVDERWASFMASACDIPMVSEKQLKETPSDKLPRHVITVIKGSEVVFGSELHRLYEWLTQLSRPFGNGGDKVKVVLNVEILGTIFEQPSSREPFLVPGPMLRHRPELMGIVRGFPMDAGFKRTDFSLPRDLTVVYGLPSMFPHMVQAASRARSGIIGDIRWNRFPGGQPNIQFSEYQNVSKILFLYDGQEDQKLQEYVIHALARNSDSVPMEVRITYFPAGTMERVDHEGILATAQSSLNLLCASMPRRVTVSVVDIHQTGTRFYTGDHVTYKDYSVMNNMVLRCEQMFHERHSSKALILVFPDDGAWKRYGHLFPEYTQVICGKRRDGESRKIVIQEIRGINNPTLPWNKPFMFTFLVIDDLIRSGGTMKSVFKVIRQEFSDSLQALYAAVVHCDFDPGRSWEFLRTAAIDRFITTNTSYEKAYKVYNIHQSEQSPVPVTVFDYLSLLEDSSVAVEPMDFKMNKGVITVASESEEKLTGALMMDHERSVYGRCIGAIQYDVPHQTAEQPFGQSEGHLACRRRYNVLRDLLVKQQGILIYAISSFAMDESTSSGPIVRDWMVVIVNDPRVHPEPQKSFEASIPGEFYPDTELCTRLLKETPRPVMGEMLRDKYNLSTKTSWLPRGRRVRQMMDALPEIEELRRKIQKKS